MSDSKELLVCDCGDCAHWEVGRNFLKCKTCSVVFKMGDVHVKEFGLALSHLENSHHQLSWKAREV